MNLTIRPALTLCFLTLAGLSVSAHATMVQTDDPGGSFDLGSGWAGQGDSNTLNIRWEVDAGFADTGFELNAAGDSATLLFATATFGSEGFISSVEADNLGITANIDLLLPEALQLSSIGLVGVISGYTCDAGFGCLFGSDSSVEDVMVEFAALQIAFGTSGLLGLELSTVSFTDDHMESDVWATFTLLQADSGFGGGTPSVPEPGTLALLAAGLIGLSRRPLLRAARLT